MRNVNLCYLLKGNKILLGLKKRGFGKDKWNGFGGKPEPGEGMEQAALRETKEELGIDISAENLKKVAELDFFYPSAPADWNQKVHVFFIEKWNGEPKETEELKPSWFKTKELPFEQMWQDDPHWLLHALQGKKIKGVFTFGQDNEKVIKKKVDFVDDL